MTTCIFTEDSRRKSGKAIEVLARKVLVRQSILARSLQRGELLNPTKLKVHIANLKNPGRISKVIVCIDSHSDPAGTREITSVVEASLAASIHVPIKYIVVVHALETWLLQDTEAVQKVLGVAITNRRLQRIGNSCQPDRALNSLSHSFDKSIHDERLAQQADVDLIASRNSSFREFVDALKGS